MIFFGYDFIQDSFNRTNLILLIILLFLLFYLIKSIYLVFYLSIRKDSELIMKNSCRKMFIQITFIQILLKAHIKISLKHLEIFMKLQLIHLVYRRLCNKSRNFNFFFIFLRFFYRHKNRFNIKYCFNINFFVFLFL